MSVAGGVRSLGSPALTLCAIAAGRLEAYCEYTMDAWDIAACQLILEQAGGRLRCSMAGRTRAPTAPTSSPATGTSIQGS